MSKLRPSKEKRIVDAKIELKLLPRLKAVGYILMCFGIAAYLFAYFTAEEETLEKAPYAGIALVLEDTPFDLSPNEVLNFYAVGTLFLCGGGALLFVARRKRKRLLSSGG